MLWTSLRTPFVRGQHTLQSLGEAVHRAHRIIGGHVRSGATWWGFS